jgi:peptidyl-prolyl cis-trans isomerase SurA
MREDATAAGGLMKILRVLLGAVCVLALTACGAGLSRGEEPVLLDGVAAYVNEQAVTVGEVLAALEPVRRQLAGRFSGEELQAKLRKAYGDTLNSLVEQRLILDAYERQPMKLPEWAPDQRVDQIIHEKFDGDRSALLQQLAAEGLTFDEWRKEVENYLVTGVMRREHVEQYVHVAPSAVEAQYAADVDRYTIPAKAKLRMILVEKDAASEDHRERRERAEAALARLQAGADFVDVAREVSADSRAAEGGDWGWVELSMLRLEVAHAVRDLEAGETTPLIETQDGFYIVKCEGRQQQRARPFEEVRSSIERDLERAESERLYEAWISRLKSQASVRILAVDPFR